MMIKKDLLNKVKSKVKDNPPVWCESVKQSATGVEIVFKKGERYFSIDFDTPNHGKGKYHIQANMYIYNDEILKVKQTVIPNPRETIYFGNYNMIPHRDLEQNYFFN